MENPWRSLPSSPPFALPADATAVGAFNRTANDDHRLRTELLPEPYIGRADAPVVLLNLNPGFHELDHLTYRGDHTRDIWNRNALHEPLDYPFYFLDPRFDHALGAGWWRQKLRSLLQIADARAIARTITCVEYFPYHSRKFKPMREVLASQRYGAYLVEQAIDREATVVVMRGRRPWEAVVPALGAYPHRHDLNSVQNVAITPRNCPAGFPAILAALERDG